MKQGNRRLLPKTVDISMDPVDVTAYGFDASSLEGVPIGVARPRGAAEVAELAAGAFSLGTVLVPRGAGTGMAGGAVPSEGGIIVSFERMNRLIELDEKNLVAVVEPGLINGRFQRELEDRGLFYPPDPASLDFCTLGGNVATNAGGPRAIKYGVTRDYVLGLEVVLANGETVRTGVRTRKGVVGYDLTSLIVGSEGTLALVTKIFLKLLPLPEEVRTLLGIFPDEERAAEAVSAIIAARIVPRTLEFVDEACIRAAEAYRPTGLPQAGALLLVEVDGRPGDLNFEIQRIGDICTSLGAEIKAAKSEADRSRLWEARRSLSPAMYKIRPTKISEDIVVPRDRIPATVRLLKELSERNRIPIAMFGHAGDGNIHVNVLTDKRDPDEFDRARGMLPEIFRITLEQGGTISGEHGIGLAKLPFLSMELDAGSISLMRNIKSVFDPTGILNPGKILPPDPGEDLT